MAIPKEFRRDVYSELERLQRINTDKEGHWDAETVFNAFVVAVQGHPEWMDVAGFCRPIFDHFDRDRRPQRQDTKQLSFFSYGASLPLGEGKRVVMHKANRVDFITWWQVETAEHVASDAAYNDKHSYFLDRLKQWGENDNVLGDVEKRIGGT